MTRTQMLDHAVVSVARKTASKFIDMSEKTQLRFWAHHPSDIPHALIAAEFGKIQRTRAFL